MEETVKKVLFNNAMKSNWKEIITIYKQDGESAHTAKITRSGDTAIHMAITSGLEEVAEWLVSSASTTPGSLEIKNDLGNTPLHLAASRGNVRMCKCIADHDSKLIGIRNKDDETPLFLAVHHGRKDAFLCLHLLCNNEERDIYSRKKDGVTILHSAIRGEYFDTAFQVICLYPKLVNSVTVDGVSALHVLASRPSAFRSGSHIRGFQRLIYHCILVDELKVESSYQALSQELPYGDKKYPENYQTCVGFVLLLYNIIRALIGSRKSRNNRQADAETQEIDQTGGQGQSTSGSQGQKFFPDIYVTLYEGLRLLSRAMVIIISLGSTQIVKIQAKKKKHIWSVQVMEKLLPDASSIQYESTGGLPPHSQNDGETAPYASPESFSEYPPAPDDHFSAEMEEISVGQKMKETETPILIAARNGIIEMVERILQLFPVAIHDMNHEKKNIVLLAVENRHPRIYKFLYRRYMMKEAIFRQRDENGNSALHLAAMRSEHRRWLIPGAALQMQWEVKWYEFVKTSMPLNFFPRYNNEEKTPQDIFTDSHEELLKEGCQWLTKTSESYSLVAALIATVAFATSTTVPGGVKSDSGIPILEHQPAFSAFAISSLIALCSSVTSLVMFLSILTSRHQEKDFGKDLPRKLLVGLTALFVSIAAILVSFCAGHFFVLRDKLSYAAFPVYVVTCLPVTVFAVAQFPLYFDVIRATFGKIPHRGVKIRPNPTKKKIK